MEWIAFIVLHLWAIVAAWRWVPQAARARYQAGARREWRALLLFYLMALVPFIQYLCGGTPWPRGTGWRCVGVIIFALGADLLRAARRVNPFFVPQIERPPYRVTTGVYAWLNHPGYVGLALQAIGQTLLLGQMLGVLPVAAYLLLLQRRARQENNLLRGL